MKTKTATSQATIPVASSSGMFTRLSRIVNRAMGAVSYRFHVAAANSWRDHYNPLRGLTITRAVHLLEDGERGAYADLQWTYRYMEMQDATLGALLERRTSAIKKLDWDVKLSDEIPAGKEAIAKRQHDHLREVYRRIANLRDAMGAMVMASFRGYAHLEKVRDGEGRIIELADVEQWFWVRPGLYGDWQYNPKSTFGTNRGEVVALPQFVIREVKRPINRVALIAFVRKGLSQKDWDGFIEAYGIPAVFVIMPENVPAEKTEEYLEAADQVTSDARGVLPGGSEIKTVDNGARGTNPFKEHLAYQDEQIVLRGTGGKLTMLAESGSGTLAGAAHSETFDAIAIAEAMEISEIFRRYIDAEAIEEVTPGEPAYAYFELAAKEETDPDKVLRGIAQLQRAGLSCDPAWIQETTGYKLLAQASPEIPLLNRLMNLAGRTTRNDWKRDPDDMLRIVTRLLTRKPYQKNRAKDPGEVTWKKFAPETGTLGIPRNVMPQTQSGNRAAMVNFLRARGIDYVKDQAKPSDLKPTQAEWSPEKVEKAKTFTGKPRAILVSSDHHVVDGHHQYLAALQLAANTPIDVFRIKAPIMEVIGLILSMSSTEQEQFNREPYKDLVEFVGAARGPGAEAEMRRAQAMNQVRKALSADLQPLGKALADALQEGDEASLKAALRKISARMPEFLSSPQLKAALGEQLTAALIGEPTTESE